MADIVITEFMDDAVAHELAQSHDVLYEPDLVERRADMLAAIKHCRAVIVRNRTRVDPEFLDHAPGLLVVGRVGVGVERIDQEACAARGVAVCPARNANDVTVAEYTIAGLLLVLRQAFLASDRVIAGDWPRTELIGRELGGRCLGLIGFGDIARQVAKRARAFDMSLMASDPYVAEDDAVWRTLGVARCGLDRLLAESDAVSLHVPLTGETRHLIDAAALACMKPGAVVVNTTRGGTIDEAALIAAIESGHLGGAVLDVFEDEPLSAATAAKFAGVPNLILTPHIAGVTEESNYRMSAITVENVLRVLAPNESQSS